MDPSPHLRERLAAIDREMEARTVAEQLATNRKARRAKAANARRKKKPQ